MDGGRSTYIINTEIETIKVNNKTIEFRFLLLDIVMILALPYLVIAANNLSSKNLDARKYICIVGPLIEIAIALIFTISAFKLSKKV